ncbi:MAG: peptidylprolyl isomerase [Devosia sp.]|uniref:peptidylprolyl isomerase n=1 Tax=Devosia sp. TaxID=1871048 RepID=UPI001ACE9178|nr:peptidylprolyl isomerase [Devosia sp.]MBN9314619.1 peptidylprolyl isomerase [Devosia sp.]
MADPIKRAGIILGIVFAVVAAFFAVSVVAPSAAHAQSGKPHWILELKDGPVDIELLPELAPNHVQRVIDLTNQGFYNGIVFHRVIAGFMAQGGDPTGTGMGGSDLPDLKAEFTDKVKFERGVVAAARSNDPDSANSQFFIMFAEAPWLDGQYTIWGKVVAGMDIVDKIKKGDGDQPVADPDKIISAKIEYK